MVCCIGLCAVSFLDRGAWFNFACANAMFWAIGFLVALDHGYDEERDSKGRLQSGERGSGVFIITVILFIVATLLLIIKMVRDAVNRACKLLIVRADQGLHQAQCRPC